jgi:hypothetical protein
VPKQEIARGETRRPRHLALAIQRREALRQAFNLSAAGLAITHVVKRPDDAIEISAPQIRRLWQWIGMLNN